MTPSPHKTTTFVTVFMDIYKGRPCRGRDLVWRFEKFFEIVETGIQLCVYVDKTGEQLLKEYESLFPNIHLMDIVSLENTWVYRLCEQYMGGDSSEETLKLPDNRTVEKDTFEYMWLMNSKIEFLHDAIQRNPFQSTHFAWIDFNISHVFRNLSFCKKMLQFYSSVPLKKKFLCVPGCWNKQEKEKEENNNISKFLNQINWRFCGGFFIGDKDSVEHFYQLYQTHFPSFIFKYRKLVWEVNFWAWLETFTDWCPDWFLGDHNDSIIQIPADYYSYSLKETAGAGVGTGTGTETGTGAGTWAYKKTIYKYLEIPDFLPCSASLVECGKWRILNTRYVNYRLTPLGYYLFNHPEHKIITRNVVSILDNQTWEPTCFIEIDDPDPTELPSRECGFQGMEDIRLFLGDNGDGVIENDNGAVERGRLSFIATSVNYSNTNRNKMVMGKIEVDFVSKRGKMVDCKLIHSPSDWYEKNWIPLGVGGLGGENGNGNGNEKFIYKWSPFEIGKVDDSNPPNLKIEVSRPYSSFIFEKFRGSSIFVKGFRENELIGVVHFSEGNSPRHYFHCLVVLNATTFLPIRYSAPFYFENIGIEFCIGFAIENGKYCFWISQFDRDPAFIKVDVETIPLIFFL